MKVSILLSTLAVLLGAASLLLSSPHAPGEAEGLSGGGVMRADASTAEHLRGEVARLIERIEALEADDSTPIEAPIRGRSGPGWVTEEQLEARLAELLEVVLTRGPRKTEASSMSPLAFDAALEAAERRESDRKSDGRRGLGEESLNTRTLRFQRELGLEHMQAMQLLAALDKHGERNTEVMALHEAEHPGSSWSVPPSQQLRQVMRGNRKALITELSLFLDEEQCRYVVDQVAPEI